MQKFNQFKPKKRTLDIQSMPQNEKEYTYFVKTFSKLHKKITQKRLFKPLAAGTLALFMGIGTLCGVLLAPMNSTRASTGATSASNLGDHAASLQSEIKETSYLGLNPSEDPIIYENDKGLQIKYHQAFETTGALSSGSLSGYMYISMGTYSGKIVNWIVIGMRTGTEKYYDGTNNLGTTYYGWTWSNWKQQSTSKSTYFNDNHSSTPALTAINTSSNTNAIVYDFKRFTPLNVVETSEIPVGTILCISECVLGTTVFHSSKVSANYNACDIKNTMNNFYNSTLGLTSAQKQWIQPTSLINSYYNGSLSKLTTSTSTNQYMFPLGTDATNRHNGESFPICTYLTTAEKRKAYAIGTSTITPYWLRTGCCNCTSSSDNTWNVHGIDANGGVSACNRGNFGYTTGTGGCRPACLIKI